MVPSQLNKRKRGLLIQAWHYQIFLAYFEAYGIVDAKSTDEQFLWGHPNWRGVRVGHIITLCAAFVGAGPGTERGPGLQKGWTG